MAISTTSIAPMVNTNANIQAWVAFFDTILATSAAGYNPGDPQSVVTESAAYGNTYNTIVATLESNNSSFPDEASALRWALGKAGVTGATVTSNDDGSLTVKANGDTLNISNIDNRSE